MAGSVIRIFVRLLVRLCSGRLVLGLWLGFLFRLGLFLLMLGLLHLGRLLLMLGLLRLGRFLFMLGLLRLGRLLLGLSFLLGRGLCLSGRFRLLHRSRLGLPYIGGLPLLGRGLGLYPSFAAIVAYFACIVINGRPV